MTDPATRNRLRRELRVQRNGLSAAQQTLAAQQLSNQVAALRQFRVSRRVAFGWFTTAARRRDDSPPGPVRSGAAAADVCLRLVRVADGGLRAGRRLRVARIGTGDAETCYPKCR